MAKYLSSTTSSHPRVMDGKPLPSVEFPGFNIAVYTQSGADKLADELNKLDNVRHALHCVLTDVKDMLAEGSTNELIHLFPRIRHALNYGVDVAQQIGLERPVEADFPEMITCIHTGKLVPKV